MLNDWSGIDIDRAVDFLGACRVNLRLFWSSIVFYWNYLVQTYEGGYGQSPFCEAHGASKSLLDISTYSLQTGGTTYTAIASLALASVETKRDYLSPRERQVTIDWLIRKQHHVGGFCGRTGKDADSCYCFWSAAALKVRNSNGSTCCPPQINYLQILGGHELVDLPALVKFIGACQFKFGGIAKSPGDNPGTCASISHIVPC